MLLVSAALVGQDIIIAVVKGVEVGVSGPRIALIIIDQIIGVEALLIRFLELLADVVPFDEAVLVGTPRVVQVGVEVKELAPGEVYVVDVLVNLLSHVQEVLSRHRVVDHRHAARLLVALTREEGGFLTKVIYLLGRVGKHVVERSFSIAECVHGGSKLIGRTAPLGDIFAPKQFLLALIQVDALLRITCQRLLSQPVSLLIRLGLLSQIFEPGGEILVHELTRSNGMIAMAHN